jgi:hypothetical protein
MKMKKWIIQLMVLFVAVGVQANRLAWFNDGTVADTGALRNLANASYCAALGLDVIGFDDGAMVTRTEFGKSGSTPAGPTSGGTAGSEWLFARSTGVRDTPTSTADYFRFTVTADAGKILKLTNVTFDLTSVANDHTATGTYTAQVFVAVDGGAFTSIGSSVSSTVDATGWSAVTSADIDLSMTAGASSVEIRIGLGDGGLDSPSGAAFVQGIQANGSVIPSPAGT